MARHQNKDWNIGEINGAPSWQQVYAATLMDIRDELRMLRQIFQCRNFQDIPRKLDRIQKNTEKCKPKLKVVRTKAA